jgi:hypothetical protein
MNEIVLKNKVSHIVLQTNNVKIDSRSRLTI